MNPTDPHKNNRDTPQEFNEPADKRHVTSSAENGPETVDEAGSTGAALPEAPEAGDEESSAGDDLAGLDEAEGVVTTPDKDAPNETAESSAAGAVFDESDDSVSPTSPGADSTPAAVDSSGPAFPFSEIHGRTTLGRPFFGSISQLAELPDYMTEHLDAESAANLKAAMENSDQNVPVAFDQETIRDLQASFPRSTGTAADFETPWYDSALPPLRLEVVLLKYDAIVNETIDRASQRIEKATDGHVTHKINGVLFQLRSEMRALWR